MRWFLAAVLVVLAGCQHFYNRDDLDVSLLQHHVNLRWGRLENAAQTVKPEMRGAFLTSWAARLQTVELQDIEVAGVAMNKAGDAADVVVNLTYVDKASMTVKTVSLPEHWVRTDDGWLVDKPAEITAAAK